MINIKGHIVDVVRREIFDGELVIKVRPHGPTSCLVSLMRMCILRAA